MEETRYAEDVRCAEETAHHRRHRHSDEERHRHCGCGVRAALLPNEFRLLADVADRPALGDRRRGSECPSPVASRLVGDVEAWRGVGDRTDLGRVVHGGEEAR